MKKIWFIFLLVLSVFILNSCNTNKIKHISFKKTNNFETLSKVNYPNAFNKKSEIDDDFLYAINNFTDTVIKELSNINKSFVFSPASLYTALAELLNGISDEDAKKELLNLLNGDINNINENVKKIYENNYYKNNYGESFFANAIFINQKLNINDQYVKLLKNNFYTTSYRVNFKDKEVKDNIINWINHYTKDELNLTSDNYEIDDNLEVLLLNTIYFNNKWLFNYNTEQTVNRAFHKNNNEIENIDFMNHVIDTYYENTCDYILVEDYFENENTITYITPKYGLDSLKNYNIFDLGKSKEFKIINLSVPKFELNNSFNLNDTLRSLNVNKIFNDSNSLKNIAEGLVVSTIRQDVAIKLSEEGAKASVATSIGLNKMAAPIEDINLILNRPFIYIIKDKEGIPLFIGYFNGKQ